MLGAPWASQKGNTMKFFSNGQTLMSASDLTRAAQCEWAYVRSLDEKLGHPVVVPQDNDPIMDQAAVLGGVHEQRVLEDFHRRFPGEVVEIAPPDRSETDEQFLVAMRERMAQTLAAVAHRKRVIFQATFISDDFQGFADFLILNEDGVYEVFDTKLARKAKVTALLQMAAYADQLLSHNIPVGERVTLILGSREESSHRLRDIMPVFLKRKERLRRTVAHRVANMADGGEALRWNDPDVPFCGRCAACEEQVVLYDDLLLVADMRLGQRKKLREAGIETLEQLATTSGPVPGIINESLAALRAQAQVQFKTRQLPEGAAPHFEVDRPEGLSVIPAPSAGDIFFDFEGDPLYEEDGKWNLDYLFGFVDASGVFHAYWAHNLAGEKDALDKFMSYLMKHRAEFPDMHIYHYASYEQTHLLQLAQRHAVWENEVDDLVRSRVLVNLYPIVKRSIRIGTPSYSLKKIEKIYNPTAHQGDGVNSAVDSVVEYNAYRTLVEIGDHAGAAQKLVELEAYNTEDCESTIKLRDWLLGNWDGGYPPELPVKERDASDEIDRREETIEKLIAGYEDVEPHNRSAYQDSLALAVAAVEYHSRERKSFWWAHYQRLAAPLSQWEDQRDVVVATDIEVLSDWKPVARSLKRRIKISGVFAPGTNLRLDGTPFVLYDPAPEPLSENVPPGSRAAHDHSKVIDVSDDNAITLEERVGKTEEPWPHLPMALAPAAPFWTTEIRNRIVDWAERVGNLYPEPPRDAAFDILLKRPPQGRVVGINEAESPAQAIVESLLSLDHSYLAVQGPPGAGKTHNAAEVIKTLIEEHGWKIGVVAQSHATVENLLRAVAKTGVDSEKIGKKLRTGQKPNPSEPWVPLAKGNEVAAFVSSQAGIVVGGTVWTFSSSSGFSYRDLDLLVVDEAGQFSLADTIACSTAARNLLLLGDPQQLPQVSQGVHPEPINESALGWLSTGHDVLPSEFGVFLDQSWRMHEAVCIPVSELSYEGKLTSKPSDRAMSGIEPGVHPVAVHHQFNATASVEEATAVVELVRNAMERDWTMGGETKALAHWDKNVIVVAAYNAQVNTIRKALDQAGFPAVPVGTVDKFQGQEAPIAILSMAASSVGEVPRGIEFLLMKNRLNVAISRAQWASYIVYSPELTDFLPQTPQKLALLAGFVRLVEGGEGGVRRPGFDAASL